jgi:hypothetical protein
MKLTLDIKDLLHHKYSPVEPLCSRIRDVFKRNPDLVDEIMAMRDESAVTSNGDKNLPFYVISHPVVSAVIRMMCEIQDRDFKGIDALGYRATYPNLDSCMRMNYVDAKMFMIGDDIDRTALLNYFLRHDKTKLELEI